MSKLVEELLERQVSVGNIITIDQMIEEIEINQYQNDINLYKLETSIPSSTYFKGIVRNLTFEVEKGLIFASDQDDIIQDNELRIRYFLEKNVKILKLNSEDEDSDLSSYKIVFSDEFITIKAIEN